MECFKVTFLKLSWKSQVDKELKTPSFHRSSRFTIRKGALEILQKFPWFASKNCRQWFLSFLSSGGDLIFRNLNQVSGNQFFSDFTMSFRSFAFLSFSYITEVYSEPCQTSKMERFGKTIFSQNTPSLMFDRVLNMPLYCK